MDIKLLYISLTLVVISNLVVNGEIDQNQVWSLHGKSAVLECEIPANMRAPVMWLHPHTGIAISINHRVMIPELSNRITVIGDKTQRQHNLLIKYVTFPDDAGEWKCITLGIQKRVNLSVIVPPIERIPMVNPTMLTDFNHEAWTFTCSAQYAVPPVNLTWVKISGPEMKYDVTLPNYVVSSQNHIAVTLRLIVSPLNFGSVFKCISGHPSFESTGENTVIYAPPMSQIKEAASHKQRTFSHEDITSMIQTSKLSQPSMNIGIHEKMSILIILAVAVILLSVCAVMFTRRRHWQWNDVTLHQDAKGKRKLNKCRFFSKVFIWMVLSVVLTVSLCLSFPLYMKGITIPLLGTDMLMSVSAGSALWMDCGSKIQPIESLLQVTWSYNFQPFFHQYLVNRDNVGFPTNSTLGYMVGMRTQSYRVGQISVWPILPGEDGIYSCEVAGLEDNSGKTRIKRKTFGVFVVTGPYLNKPLLVLFGVGLMSSVLTFFISGCHIVRCGKPKKQFPTLDIGNHLERENTLRKMLTTPLMMGSVR